MAVILNRRGNIKTEQSKKNLEGRAKRGRIKTHPKVKAELKKIKDSIEAAKTPQREVRIKTLRNLPKNAHPQTRAFLKKEPVNINPETKRKRAWKYQRYSTILPPQTFIRRVARQPHATLVGRISERIPAGKE